MSTNTQISNKRIAKNTMHLYFRMLFSMFIGLYTSRVVLQHLGVENFGIYNIVGGVVSMFSLISGSLTASISRFLTFSLAKGDTKKLSNTFSTSLVIQTILAIIVFIIGETIGLWVLKNFIVIPTSRMNAAIWVYHFSIITFSVNLIKVPFNSVIIAHEKMSIFAYLSIVEVFSKLLIAVSLNYTDSDRLIHYSLLNLIVAVIIFIIYVIYSTKKFPESKLYFTYDNSLLKDMFSFAGWNFIGSSSGIFNEHGTNIIINLFFGTIVNASRGIATQVNNAIQAFANNFMTALNPQITKSYATGDYVYLMTLIFQGSRLSYYLLLILSLPIIFSSEYVLHLWLGTVPDHASNFVILVLIYTMSESLSLPMITAMLATGNIRNYQIIVGGLKLINLPLSFLCLKIGLIPESVYIIAIIISQICLAARLYILQPMIKIQSRLFLTKVYLNILKVTFIASIFPFIIHIVLPISIYTFIIQSVICLICTSLSIWYIGCTEEERTMVYTKIKKIILSENNK